MQKLKKTDIVLIEGRRWFDKVNGNTYHSATLYVNNKKIDRVPFEYGYGDSYIQTGYTLIEKNYNIKISGWRDLEGYNVRTTVQDGLKRDL